MITRKLAPLLFVCFCLLVLEGGARLFISIKPIYLRVITHRCDATWRWQWVERHNTQGIKIYYRFDIYDPAKGWALRPNISNMVCFKDKIVNSNSKGIRGKTEYAYGKNRQKTRLLILGDSFTFGDDVSDNETYPYYLQELLPNAEVINFGVHGYGHDQMLIYLQEEGIKYKPDIIILSFISEDADRNMLKFRDYAKPRFQWVNNALQLGNVPVPDPETTLKKEPWRSRFVDLVSIAYRMLLKKTGLYEAQKEKLTNAILKEIAVTAKGIPATPVFVYLSNIRSKESQEGMTLEERNFLDQCKNMTVACIFLRSDIQSARRQGMRIKESGHYDAKTHRLVALGIKEQLIKAGLIDEKGLSQ